MPSPSTPRTPKRRSLPDTDLVKTPGSPSKRPRTSDPKVFGHIPGVEVGAWWEKREDCSQAAVHAPWVAGIAGGKLDGAFSIALSGGYEDDEDSGYTFTYTGAGGRDLKGTPEKPKNLRTAPQSEDQSYSHPHNAALKKSFETKNPIRVVRGFKLNSEYAPPSGYRYDGLYVVERTWMERGKEGFKVCRFGFRRLEGQPPLHGTTHPVKGEADAKTQVTIKSEINDLEMAIEDPDDTKPEFKPRVGGGPIMEAEPGIDPMNPGVGSLEAPKPSVKNEMDATFGLNNVEPEVRSDSKLKVEPNAESCPKLEIMEGDGSVDGGSEINNEARNSPEKGVEPAFDGQPEAKVKPQVDEGVKLEARVDVVGDTPGGKVKPDTGDETLTAIKGPTEAEIHS